MNFVAPCQSRWMNRRYWIGSLLKLPQQPTSHLLLHYTDVGLKALGDESTQTVAQLLSSGESLMRSPQSWWIPSVCWLGDSSIVFFMHGQGAGRADFHLTCSLMTGKANAEKATAVRTIRVGSDSRIVHLHLPRQTPRNTRDKVIYSML